MGAARFRCVAQACAIVLGLAFSSCVAAAEPLRLVVASVSVDIDPRSGETILSIRLDEDSRRRFAQFSVANLGQVIDIRIDGKSVTKPVIRDPIVGGIFLVPIKQPAEARQLAAHLTDRTAALEMEAVPK